MGLPYYQHDLAPFVAESFHFSLKSTAQGGVPKETAPQDNGAARHPIWRVFDWQRRLGEDKALTKVQIGEQKGLSKARMTQMFSLLHLPKDAQDYPADLNQLIDYVVNNAAAWTFPEVANEKPKDRERDFAEWESTSQHVARLSLV